MNQNEKPHKRRSKNRWTGTFTSGKCDVRLTPEENSMLNELAEKNSVSRSDVIRRALKDFYFFNTEKEKP